MSFDSLRCFFVFFLIPFYIICLSINSKIIFNIPLIGLIILFVKVSQSYGISSNLLSTEQCVSLH